MRLRELITEHILNLRTTSEKRKYSDEVWDMLQKSYASIGGFKTANTKDELVNEFPLWKIVTRNGRVTAVRIEKNKYGRKLVGLGTNGTIQGRKDATLLLKSYIAARKGWSETSGAVEHILQKLGAKPIPAKFAEFLTKKNILEIKPDGYHYVRLINGKPVEKIIFGFVNLTPEDTMELEKQGLDIHDLPKSK